MLLVKLVLIIIFDILNSTSFRLSINLYSSCLFTLKWIVYLLKFVYFASTIVDFFEKILVKSKYLIIITFIISD